MSKQVLTKQQLLDFQQEGLTRKEIAVKLEVSPQEVDKYFKHYGIKGKAKKKLKFQLEPVPVDNKVSTDAPTTGNGQSKFAELESQI